MSNTPRATTRLLTGTGRWAEGPAIGVPLGVLEETHTYDEFTDGGGASGTLTLTGTLPAGAVVLGSKWTVTTGFTGNVSATLKVGDGTDADRYNTGTPSIYTAGLVDPGVPSGVKLLLDANHPVLTVTANADFTSVSAGNLTVSIYYLRT